VQELELEDEGLQLGTERRVAQRGAAQASEREDQPDKPEYHPDDTAGAGAAGGGDPAVSGAALGDDRGSHHQQTNYARRCQVVNGPDYRQPPAHQPADIRQAGERCG